MLTDDKAIYDNINKIYAGAEVVVRREGEFVFVKITSSYSAPEHGLSMSKYIAAMCAAVGADDFDSHDEFDIEGCETCDYGSCYGTEFKFWND